jgi:hypothetical protein
VRRRTNLTAQQKVTVVAGMESSAADWSEHVDVASGETYYVNEQTQETQLFTKLVPGYRQCTNLQKSSTSFLLLFFFKKIERYSVESSTIDVVTI